jgi:hypothetical protein
VQPLITPEQPFPDQLTEHDRCHARLADRHVGRGCAAVMACQPYAAEGGPSRHKVQDCTEAFDQPGCLTQDVHQIPSEPIPPQPLKRSSGTGHPRMINIVQSAVVEAGAMCASASLVMASVP